MVDSIALGSYAILLVIVGVTWNKLVCVNLLDVFHANILHFDMRGFQAVWVRTVSTCIPMFTQKYLPEALWIAILTCAG